MKRFRLSHEDIVSADGAQFLEPPDSYGIVTETIYRCGPLSPAHFSFLSLMPIKSVLFIGEDYPSTRIEDFLTARNIRFVTRNTRSTDSRAQKLPWSTRLDEFVKSCLEILLNRKNHPILLSSSSPLLICTLVGCLRKMQGWNVQSIIYEFRRFTPGQTMSLYKNYVEMFDFDLIALPSDCILDGQTV